MTREVTKYTTLEFIIKDTITYTSPLGGGDGPDQSVEVLTLRKK